MVAEFARIRAFVAQLCAVTDYVELWHGTPVSGRYAVICAKSTSHNPTVSVKALVAVRGATSALAAQERTQHSTVLVTRTIMLDVIMWSCERPIRRWEAAVLVLEARLHIICNFT